jgi:hypothetical protein
MARRKTLKNRKTLKKRKSYGGLGSNNKYYTEEEKSELQQKILKNKKNIINSGKQGQPANPDAIISSDAAASSSSSSNNNNGLTPIEKKVSEQLMNYIKTSINAPAWVKKDQKEKKERINSIKKLVKDITKYSGNIDCILGNTSNIVKILP